MTKLELPAVTPLLPLRPIGAERVGVRWGFLQRQANCRHKAFEIFNYVAVPKTNDAITMTRYLGATPCVSVSPLTVLAAVKLDRKLARWACKIDNAPSDRMLAAKLPRRTALAKCTPKPALDISGVAAKLARAQSPGS